MTKRSMSGATKLRRGTQEILERRGMVANPGPLPPLPPMGGPKGTRQGPYLGGIDFSHGGRRALGMATPLAGPAHHPELPGHRHRGAEQHSATHSAH